MSACRSRNLFFCARATAILTSDIESQTDLLSRLEIDSNVNWQTKTKFRMSIRANIHKLERYFLEESIVDHELGELEERKRLDRIF